METNSNYTFQADRGCPEPGQLVEVRRRQWIVSDVVASNLECDSRRQNCVKLSSIDEDSLGEELEVIWEIEPGAHIIEHAGLPSITGQDEASTLDALSSLDASKVLRHVVALETLTGSAATAADVNNSGSITAQDAFQILQYVAGLSTLPFNGSSSVWRFSPETRTFNNLSSNQSNQHFTGILLGDTTGNWGTVSNPAAPEAPSASAGLSGVGSSSRMEASTELSLHNSTGLPGSRVETGLTLDAVSGGFLSLDFDITYDPTVAEVASVTKSALLEGWSVFINTQTPGVIRIAAAGTEAVTNLGELFALAFNIVGEEAVISELSVENLRIDEGQVSADITNGVIRSADPIYIFNDRFSEPTPQ